MKKIFNSASSLFTALLVGLFICSFAACTSDSEDSEKRHSIVGLWYKSDDSKYTYYFDTDGTGHYETGGDVWGGFRYTNTYGEIVISIKYMNNKTNSIWTNTLEGSYFSTEDKLWIEGSWYLRKQYK